MESNKYINVLVVVLVMTIVFGGLNFQVTDAAEREMPSKVLKHYSSYGIEGTNDEEFIREVENILDERMDIEGKISNKALQSDPKPAKRKRYIPKSTAGDVIWTNNPLTPFNHVGMYISDSRIIEALTGGVYKVKAGTKRVEFPFKIYKVTTKKNGSIRYSPSTRNKVVKWASSQNGKSYDYNFYDNKQNTKEGNAKLNCSELVWKAWKFKVNVDLDSNGGKGVYPNNIKNSNRTKYIRGDK